MTITSRQMQSEDEYEAVRDLLRRMYAAEGSPSYCSLGDLDWWRYTDEDPEAIWEARIWLGDSEQVVGFAWPNGGRVDHFSDPSYHHIESEMLAWAEAQIRAGGNQTSMTAVAYDAHPWRHEQLRALGFEQASDGFRSWHRTLDEIPEQQPLGEYIVRNVCSEDDLPARVAAHRDAFAPSKMTIAKHLAVMGSPTYRSDLDLIVEAPDGTVAAYCIVWLDEANGNGSFEPVGCHSAHQRRGLAKAVMYEGMRRLRDLGATTATVISNPTEVAANRLYSSAGFTSLGIERNWVKQLAP